MLSIARKRLFSTRVVSYDALLRDLTTQVKFDAQNRITNIPESPYKLDPSLDHAPKRTHSLTPEQVDQAIRNHLIYFAKELHSKLDAIFREELKTYGHIYMFNYLPRVHPEALPYDMIPGQTMEARAMIHMILNNLDPKVAQFP